MQARKFSLLRIVKLLGVCAVLLGALLYVDYAYGLRRPPRCLWKQNETEHFHIYTDLKSDMQLFYEDFFEGFYDYFCNEYFEIGQKRRLKAYLFRSELGYAPYAQSLRQYTPYGFYMGPWVNIIVVNCKSGLGTTTHELVHHFIATSFETKPPKWVDEGIATFFEKFIGHLGADGNLTISFGYFSNWRFPETKRLAKWLSIESLVTLEQPDQSAARSLMLFLHKKGLF